MNSPNRNLAIIAYVQQQHHTVAQTARHFNVSRQWIYTLLRRYHHGGADAVLPQPTTPHTNPHATPPAIRREIITIRTNLTKHGFDAGPETIRTHLARQGLHTPSTSTIRRILHAEGLITPQPAKRPRTTYIRFQAAQPNECWQADITHTTLTNGHAIDILDFLDDHSRYLLSITAYHHCSGINVVDTMTTLIKNYGPPASTLTDNGLVFTARLAGAKGGRNGFEVLLNTHGIQQKNGRPGHPQTQGKIERFHQTLKKWLAKQPRAATIEALQIQLDTFADYYNNTRPHRALHNRTPHEAYTALAKATPSTHIADEWRTRHDKVDTSGRVTIRYAGKLFHLGVGRKHQGQAVTMVIVDKHVTTALTDTGEIITEHIIDTARDYQKPWRKY